MKRRGMETISTLLAICAMPADGWIPIKKGQWCKPSMISSMLAWTIFWTNTRVTINLRRRGPHVTSHIMTDFLLATRHLTGYYQCSLTHRKRYTHVIFTPRDAYINDVKRASIYLTPAYWRFVQFCSGWHQKKHQSPTSLAFCEGNPPVTLTKGQLCGKGFNVIKAIM